MHVRTYMYACISSVCMCNIVEVRPLRYPPLNTYAHEMLMPNCARQFKHMLLICSSQQMKLPNLLKPTYPNFTAYSLYPGVPKA